MNVEDEVRSTIARALNVPIDQLTAETQLQDIGANSLDVVEIIFDLEEKFDITIPAQISAQQAPRHGLEYDTVGAVAQAIKGLVDAKHS